VSRPAPERGADEVAQRLRVRYARRGRLRFASHRDVARALERALRQAEEPVAFSGGFSRHPRISYAGAAPTGCASEAEYFEIALAAAVDPGGFAARLDAALPAGLDVLDVVPVRGSGGGFADRLQASRWRVVLPEHTPEQAAAAVERFLAAGEVRVTRRNLKGSREFDARGAVVSLVAGGDDCAILEMVLRQVTPAVRPDDVLAGLCEIAALKPAAAALATRLAQGPLGPSGELADPLAEDRGELAGQGRPAAPA
jgi:radical SAM-linked protein